MKIFVPEWVKHSTAKAKTPIYSVSINPINEKLATAGQDFKVKIWNMAPIRNDQLEKDEAVPKLLSTLVLHDGAVLCVRWSPDGQLLASGSDDTKVVIWQYDATSRSAFGTSPSIENYRAVKVLMGHESDVADLQWSPDQQYLASCGFDSKVFIWDGSNFDRITCIQTHTAFVKGISWDPAGSFIATQSDDKTVKVHRTSDWKVEKEFTAPFDISSTTFFRRLSWSPDGGSIATVNGESSGLCVSPVIYREDWQSSVCLVGHEAPIEVASFNPNLYSFKDPKTGTVKQSGVCALGSQDNGISVWWTGSARAVASAQQIFTHSVLDLAWTPDGVGLVGCSYDGTVVFLEFDVSDFGSKVSIVDQKRALQKYGSRKTRRIIPEGVEIIDLESQLANRDVSQNLLDRIDDGVETRVGFSNQENENPFIQSNAEIMSKPPVKVVDIAIEKQSVSLTKDGKKRIKPVLLTSSPQKTIVQTPMVSLESVAPAEQPVHPILKKQKVVNESVLQTAVTYVLPISQKEAHPNLKVPNVRSMFTASITHNLSQRTDVVEFKNNANGCSISLHQGNEMIWNGSYKSSALLANFTDHFIAITYSDASLHLYTLAGTRALPPLKMNSAVSYMFGVNQYLFYLDCIGNAFLWNVVEQRCVLSNITCLPILSKNAIITGCKIHKDGMPILTISTNEMFIFSKMMDCWMQLDPLESSPIGFMKSLPKMDQIEMNFITAIQLQDTHQIENSIKLYSRKLADEDATSKAKELLYMLRGEGFLGTVPKRALLESIIPILAKNRSFQRILTN